MKTYKFKATIQPGMGGGAGVVFPYDVEKEFGTKTNIRVRSTLDGIPYTGSLMNCGAIGHTLGVLKGIREQIGKGPATLSRSNSGRMKRNESSMCLPNLRS